MADPLATGGRHRHAGGLVAGYTGGVDVFLMRCTDAPVEVHFRWRPQLVDTADELVLEAAINGRATAIVTFNRRDFVGRVERFGLEVASPAQILRRVDP